MTKWFADHNNRTGPGAASRTFEILKHVLNKAETWGYRLENTKPCRSVRPNKRKHCERFLSMDELARFGMELAELRSSDNPTIPAGCAVITLLLLTGCRYREIMGLQWQEVKGSRLLLRDSKTGPRTVWLGPAARSGDRQSAAPCEDPLALLELSVPQADAVNSASVGAVRCLHFGREADLGWSKLQPTEFADYGRPSFACLLAFDGIGSDIDLVHVIK